MDHYRNIKEFYKIERTIGKGSFATVRKAKRRDTGERFAVKVLSKRKMTDEDKMALKVETEIMKQVDHPNIVKMVDFFEDEEQDDKDDPIDDIELVPFLEEGFKRLQSAGALDAVANDLTDAQRQTLTKVFS